MANIPILAQSFSLIVNLITVLIFIIKPFREKVFGIGTMRNGQRCILRSEMLSIYYAAKDNGRKVRQYEYENFVLLYAAYKEMRGNSFIDKIYEEMKRMEVIS